MDALSYLFRFDPICMKQVLQASPGKAMSSLAKLRDWTAERQTHRDPMWCSLWLPSKRASMSELVCKRLKKVVKAWNHDQNEQTSFQVCPTLQTSSYHSRLLHKAATNPQEESFMGPRVTIIDCIATADIFPSSVIQNWWMWSKHVQTQTSNSLICCLFKPTQAIAWYRACSTEEDQAPSAKTSPLHCLFLEPSASIRRHGNKSPE